MRGMEQAHLTAQAIPGIPPVDVQYDEDLLENIAQTELQRDHPAQQISTRGVGV
eukprot:CAMPEP_0183478436 /NCGR_PEP_ID=MMETSP0370-20130417/169902_1 /TAXON_ID=268820 /ORGANISM="Peridinium aciculiferum, Strain PAER-2" /LENGTH=53 /DNA_ID=CAMNT_0025671389 /DNA_START=322 /DNA_END=483 /DNA_ORIENTATION=+